LFPGDSLRLVAIGLAVLAAVALAFGAQFQNDAVVSGQVNKNKRRGSLTLRQLTQLVTKPKWLSGTVFMGLGIGLQLGALSLAPLIVVQPIGAIALVLTSILNAKLNHTRINRATVFAIIICTLGIASFVLKASGVASVNEITDDRLREILLVLLVILLIFGVLFYFFGKKGKALTYIIGAGVLYGFVATLAKVVIQRAYQNQFELLTLLCLISLLVATVLGGWFVQNAYASGPPDLVIAGLTVIDPLVAVSIAIVILGEAKLADFWSILAFSVSGMVSVVGVFLMSRVHPELSRPGKSRQQG